MPLFTKKKPAANKKIKSSKEKTISAQQTIPFERMFPDGTCRVGDGYYTQTIQFHDINYQLAKPEDQEAIYDEWCGLLNFFDSSIHFELTFFNTNTDLESFEKAVRLPLKNDGFDDVRTEYSTMLKSQLEKGNNGLTKTKYLTFGIEAPTIKSAKPKLYRIQADLINNFHRLGVSAQALDGKERLKLMHDMFHMGDTSKFFFDWKRLIPSGLDVKDFIAPTSFSFQSRTFTMGGLYGAMSFLNITAPELSDQLLKDFLDTDSGQIISLHIHSLDQNQAL